MRDHPILQHVRDLKYNILHRIQSQIASPRVARILFYPTLLWNVVTVGLSNKKHWYDRIDENVVLGALPLRIISQSLVQNENIGGVVTLNEYYETKFLMYSTQEWLQLDVKHLQLPTADFNNAPDYEKIKEGVQFIKQFDGQKTSCYVHCKAGRGRSATLVACYLIEMYNLSPTDAINILKTKRPQTLLGSNQLSSIMDFYERSNKKSDRQNINQME